VRQVPVWAALFLAVSGGLASAVQSAVNADLGERVGHAAVAAVVNTLTGAALVFAGLLAMPSMRTGLRALRTARLPWWAYLGGLGGAGFVLVATYTVPVLGVAVFVIAQVAGNSVGGLAVDRAGLAPVGRLALNGPRVTGALLGVGAVALAQLGRPVGTVTAGVALLAVTGGVAVALQAALNGRVSAAVGAGAGAVVNFGVATPAVLGAAAVLGGFRGLPSAPWPAEWYLYAGGPLGVGIVLVLLLSVRSIGVLRTGLAIVAGQLGGALLLDVLLPGRPGAGVPVLAGTVVTVVAVALSGRRTTGAAAAVRPDGRLVG